jgi:hypothetical protein
MGDGGEPPEGGTTERGEGSGGFAAVGAPAGWLGESGSGLPQSKAGGGLRAWGRGRKGNVER